MEAPNASPAAPSIQLDYQPGPDAVNRTEKLSTHNPKAGTAEDWTLMEQLKRQHDRGAGSGFRRRELGVTWKDVTVEVVSAEAAVNENVLSQFNVPQHIKESRHKPPLRSILQNSHGCVKPGEMLLVLGRPGSGCTTLLKVLSNHTKGFKSVQGDVRFGSMTPKEAAQYRGQIVMNTEEEVFFPALTVGQTTDFATRLKVPFRLPEGINSSESHRQETKQFLLESMNIEHTHDTKVGNEYLRGVSGGERKRVSIVECLASRASVFCWDNSTRGLDASTALEWTRAIRAMTDILGLSTIATLYQAGNGIYELFDKVLVLDEGKQVYYGPMTDARPFMEHLGFVCREGSNIADYLTGVTIPTERRVQPGFENRFPRNADMLQAEYLKSSIYARMVAEYDYPDTPIALERTEDFKAAVTYEKNKYLPESSPFTTNLLQQTKACVIRQYQILWGDKATFIIKQTSTLVQALIAGSLFYQSPNNSAGLFVKSGALFFSILYHSLLAMSEVIDSFHGRPVLLKHKFFAFYHPAAFCIAKITADIPVILFQVSTFSLVVYFMVGFTRSASAFFTYWILIFSIAMCMTALFRAIGALWKSFDGASKVSGFLIAALIIYTGYMIHKPLMHPWFVWIFWIDPMSYAFEALFSNEFHGKIIPCVGRNLVPSGPGYQDSQHQSCTGVSGAVQGKTFVTGEQYLASMSYSHTHVWRNFGIIWAWWALFAVVTVIATTRWQLPSEAGSCLLIPRERLSHHRKAIKQDEEAQAQAQEKGKTPSDSDSQRSEDLDKQLIRNSSVFTWKNLSYTVNTPAGDRLLLDNVQGYVKPGTLTALMGASGAGKTTLLDVLAYRKTEGTIRGSILVDGRELPISFQRSAGYCEQLDVHEPFSTVKEALIFSARLRQPYNVPLEEKLKYVDVIIDLLELQDLANTLIGRPGAGLSVEQRKRVTIGVELVAKPSLMIFLDEPTSGLDGQSAFNTVRFLRKLADVGQAVLVTIHQPSAQLFAEFDQLLLLSYGGKTMYFGDIGDNGQTVKDYFARYGAPCPPMKNPADHMIDVVSGSLSQDRDWSQVWLESPEYQRTMNEIDTINREAASKPRGTYDDGNEFATPLSEQLKVVTARSCMAVYRNKDYVMSKFYLHIFQALITSLTFFKIGDDLSATQLTLFSIFQYIFVAPGAINQLQPLFLERRDIYETREKKSKMYTWVAFVTGMIVSEIPYLIICAVLYFVCWYWLTGLPSDSDRTGAIFLCMLLYQFVYTGIGQFIAAYAPNPVFASLVNPLVIGILSSFSGVFVPYPHIQPFWRYWIYYMDPFNYLMGSLLTFSLFGKEIHCRPEQFAVFDPPNGTTCGQYLSSFMQGLGSRTNLVNPDARSNCKVCEFTTGSDYLTTVNLLDYYYGWRDTGIVAIFAISGYALVYLLMKLRTKATKTAE